MQGSMNRTTGRRGAMARDQRELRPAPGASGRPMPEVDSETGTSYTDSGFRATIGDRVKFSTNQPPNCS